MFLQRNDLLKRSNLNLRGKVRTPRSTDCDDQPSDYQVKAKINPNPDPTNFKVKVYHPNSNGHPLCLAMVETNT